MRKLIEKYKNMPPEMRMLLAAAGLGSFATIVYTINSWVFQGRRVFGLPSIVITSLAIALLTGLLYGLSSLVSKGFSLRSKKRGEKMIEDMSGDLGRGPVSMDAREAVKENNKKFFEEIREMRKQTKLNVYDLPWYIVIGDSGCGKTRLIEHSGLTFSRGRPEGYQLGTLNYNWWFTEDAIFIDMAGRLCNPQEDADHKEWQGFLNTVAKGRPACPINGAIVCISAEHLLEDPPEKIEGDANTMLERLRDLQGKLGVTFATYVVVTKCDKILGFMQFFDRAERDVEVRNQMVGWTRPAPFTDLFDPESFQGEFEGLYQRLNELRVRRLNDDAEEEELGMAYCLPEEFRELRDPLHTYLRVLFPPIKNPRAIKNLVARGVYFTSSVQQGSVILKHLKERMGPEAGENIKPLEDLYGKAKQKPLFIKHLLIRKVFPEYGLVFRNANEVARNKKYSRLLYIWSGVLAAALFGLMFWGISHFKNLIGGPQSHAVAATVASPVDRKSDPQDSTKLTAALGSDITAVEQGSGFRTWLAAPLVWNKREPIDHLKVVRAGLYQRDILPQILNDAAAAFESRSLARPKDYWPSAQAAQDKDYLDYKNALLAYARWVGWAREAKSKNDRLDLGDSRISDRKADLLTLIAWGEGAAATTQPSEVATSVEEYFKMLADMKGVVDEGQWPHPTLAAVARSALSEERAQAAVNVVRSYFQTHYATLTDAHPDPYIREWISRNGACERYLNQYEEFLKISRRKDVASAKEFEELRKAEFADEGSTLADLKKDFAIATRDWQVRNEGGVLAPIRQFDDAVKRVRDDSWIAFAGELSAAIGSDSWGNGLKESLDKELLKQLADARMLEDDGLSYSAEVFKDLPRHVADHVSKRAAAVITVKAPSEKDKKDFPDAATTVAVTESAALVQAHLQEIQRDVMAISLGSDKAAALPPGQWVSRMIKLDEPPRAPNWNDIKEHEKVWRPADLNEVAKRANEWSHRAETTNLLMMVSDKLATATKDEWGVYSLLAAKGRRGGGADDSDESASAAESDSRGSRRSPLRYGRGDGDRPTAELQSRADWPGVTPRLLGRSIDETVLFSADIQCNVQRLVKYEFKPAGGKAASAGCLENLASGLTKYFSQYTDYWSREYAKAEMESLQPLLRATTLNDLKGKLSDANRDVATELRKKVGDVLEHICWSNQSRPVESGNAEFDAEATTAVSAMMRELDGLWTSKWQDDKHKRFIREATRGEAASAGKGYEDITNALVNGWDKLVDAVQNAQVGSMVQAGTLAQAFLGARERNGLGDERLTEYVEKLAIHAADLINNQLREELCEAVRQCLGGMQVGEGLPYTSSGGVVDGRKFFEFLSKVEKLEKSAATGTQSKYAAFFDACRQWRAFLGVSEGKTTSTFSITKAETPAQYVGVQNNYRTGLLKFGGRDYKVPILERDVDSGADFQWDWQNSSGDGELILSELVPSPSIQGLPNQLRVPVGAGDSLNFCRLLRANSAGGSGRVFTITVPVTGIPGGGKPKAVSFKIELKGAGLPGPIPDPCRL